jgi:hypothetical protein
MRRLCFSAPLLLVLAVGLTGCSSSKSGGNGKENPSGDWKSPSANQVILDIDGMT